MDHTVQRYLDLGFCRRDAKDQAGWERRNAFLRAVESGATMASIARHVGLSLGTIQAQVAIARRRKAELSPIEKALEKMNREKLPVASLLRMTKKKEEHERLAKALQTNLI